MKLNKSERKYILTAVSFGWQIEVRAWLPYIGWWDGDSSMTVKIGNLCDSLIRKGILEVINEGQHIYHIRSTKLGDEFKCRDHNCHHGKYQKFDDDGELLLEENCKVCDGIGVVARNT